MGRRSACFCHLSQKLTVMPLYPLFVPALPANLAPAADPAVAYAEMLPLIEAVTPEQLVAINLDVPAVVSVVLDHGPQLQTLTADIAEELPKFDTSRLIRLPKIALAVAHAHSMAMTAAAAVTDDLSALLEIGLVLRTRLTDDMSYMIKKGVLQAQQLDQVKGLPGYRNVAFDLMALTNVLQQGGASQKSLASDDDLTKAREVAARIIQALTAREQLAAETAKATVMRQKAYTLLFRECDAIQRVVSYLRWEQDDADTFAPSIFSVRRRPRKAVATAPGTPAAPGTPGTPAVLGAIPAIPAVHTLTQASALPLPAASEAPVPPGHQGGSPFIS